LGKEESLKGIFVDFVDEEAPGASLRQLETAGKELEFLGLRDLFFAVHNKKEIDKLPTTERVKRILRRKWDAYENWQKHAIPELERRLETVEDDLRKTEAQAKMYEQWAKPYLTKQTMLEMKEELMNPDMAKSFERLVARTTLLIYRKMLRTERTIRTEEYLHYHPVLILTIYQRAIPQAVYGGSPQTRDAKVEIKIKSFVKSTEELEELIRKNTKLEEKTLWEIIEQPTKPKKEEEILDVVKQTKAFFKEVRGAAKTFLGWKTAADSEKEYVEKEVLPLMIDDFWEDLKEHFGLLSLGRKYPPKQV